MASSPPLDLIIIGAPRSGTNMLRDTLCRLPGISTWPCDEINYIWRHGNARWPSDEMPPERADERVRRYIQRAFARRHRVDACDVVVEKTCANSLRVPFVDRILPEARYIFIHRDPLDAVASAMRRWKAHLELGYTLRKARFVPFSDFPLYALRFVRNRLNRLVSDQHRLASWGPRIREMDAILQTHTLAEVCALQWRECVKRSSEAFADMPTDKVHIVRYEDFVTSPLPRLSALCGFLGRPADGEHLDAAVARVTALSVGKGRRELSQQDRLGIEPILEPGREALRRFLATRARRYP